MRYLFLILLVLFPLHVNAAPQSAAGEFADLPVAEWLQLPYRQQIKSVKALVALNRLEMCHKQILETVGCMRETGISPNREGAMAGKLFATCATDMGVQLPQDKGTGDGTAGCQSK